MTRSGSPIPRSAFAPITKATLRRPSCHRTSIVSTRAPDAPRWWRARSICRTAWSFRPTRANYIEDSGPNPRPIYAYDVVDGGTRLVNKRVLIAAEPNGTPDGFRVDMDGNLWCGWGMGNAELDGVKVFNPEGQPIGFIALPERCPTLAWGGPKRSRRFMPASHSLYSLYVNARGAKNA